MFAFCSVERGRKSEKREGGRGEGDSPRSSIARIVQNGEVAKRYAKFVSGQSGSWIVVITGPY